MVKPYNYPKLKLQLIILAALAKKKLQPSFFHNRAQIKLICKYIKGCIDDQTIQLPQIEITAYNIGCLGSKEIAVLFISITGPRAHIKDLLT